MVASKSVRASEKQGESFEPRPVKHKPRAKDIAERFPKTLDYLAK